MKAVFLLLLLGGEDEALAQFKKDFASPKPEDRASAVKTLGGTQGEKVLKTLADLIVRDDVLVRVEAAKALGGFKDFAAKAVTPLANALGANKDELVLIAIYEALGKLDQESPLPAVHKGFGSKERLVAKAAVEAAGKIRGRNSIEPLIELLQELEKQGNIGRSANNQLPGPNLPGSARTDANKEAQERVKTLKPPVTKALQSITGEKYATGEDWEVWWKKNKATFKVQK